MRIGRGYVQLNQELVGSSTIHLPWLLDDSSRICRGTHAVAPLWHCSCLSPLTWRVQPSLNHLRRTFSFCTHRATSHHDFRRGAAAVSGAGRRGGDCGIPGPSGELKEGLQACRQAPLEARLTANLLAVQRLRHKRIVLDQAARFVARQRESGCVAKYGVAACTAAG